MGHATSTATSMNQKIIVIYAIRAQASLSSIFGPFCMKFWLESSFLTILFLTFLHYEEALTSLRLPGGWRVGGGGGGGKDLGSGWSKSVVLENKAVLNFDFRNGAKKLGPLDHPLQSYG